MNGKKCALYLCRLAVLILFLEAAASAGGHAPNSMREKDHLPNVTTARSVVRKHFSLPLRTF
jgi:hypothetical protein